MIFEEKQLSLKGDTFQALQEDFDAILANTIGNMEMKGASEATMTVKLKITLEKASVRDFQANGYDALRDITKPTFSHDISSVMQVKDKKSGSLAGDYELVWDESQHKYVMRRVDDGQVTMDDYQSEDYQSAEIRSLPEGSIQETTDEDEDEYEYEDPDEEE